MRALRELARAKFPTLYRGVNGTREAWAVGETHELVGFTSTSQREDIACQFLGRAGTLIVAKNMWGVDISMFSRSPDEKEVLLEPFVSVRVTERSVAGDGASRVVCEEAADDDCGEYLLKELIPRKDSGAEVAEVLMMVYGSSEDGERARGLGVMRALASGGNPLWQYQLGRWYERGCGADKDMAEAGRWYMRSFLGGGVLGRETLARIVEEVPDVVCEFKEEIEGVCRVAERGDVAMAQGAVGMMLMVGVHFARDERKGLELVRRAAERGDAMAQYNLGVCYEDGQGVEQDFTKAVEWYEKAAEQGHVGAQYKMGVFYESGRGVKRDYSKAAKLYQKAANRRHAGAQAALEGLKK